jgi:hypothetical protein
VSREQAVTELAWAAGFFDGEGCVTVAEDRKPRVRLRRGSFRLHITVSNTKLPPLERFKTLFGGAVYQQRQNGEKAGLAADSAGRKASYFWMIPGRSAQKVLESLLPYLCTRHEQAAAALRFPILGRVGNIGLPLDIAAEQAAVYHELRRLNKRGPEPYTPAATGTTT